MKNTSFKYIVGIIPARMASSRFPGKPLAQIAGVPMVGHVYFRSMGNPTLDYLCVATCDNEIADYVRSIGGNIVMTSPKHERCIDRAAEALLKIEDSTMRRADLVVVIQGDEPMLHPSMIDEAVRPLLEGSNIQATCLMAPLKSREDQDDPNEVKVVTDLNDNALYFSREPIPSWKKGAKDVKMLKEVCIFGFTRDFLLLFSTLSHTPLEETESVDLMRILEHGYKLKMVMTAHKSYSVDTPEDLKLVEKLMVRV